MTNEEKLDIKFGDISMTLPKTINAIVTARLLLNLFEESLRTDIKNEDKYEGHFFDGDFVSEWVCKFCGCTEYNPCTKGCYWVAPNVCSGCADKLRSEKPMSETKDDAAKQLARANPVMVGEVKPDRRQITETNTANKIETTDEKVIKFPSVIPSSALKIPPFPYDKKKMRQFRNIFFIETPSGTVINYRESHYYTTKDRILQLPFPFPEHYFTKENGWSSSVEQAFKIYRKYLAEQNDDEDDWKYRRILKTDTKGNHGEDFEQLQGVLE